MTKPTSRPKPIPFVSTGYWLLKSEPESYSIDLFAKEKKTLWTGVRNYQARNFMVDSMKPGDKFIFYHSNAEPSAAVGVGAVVRPNQADPSALDKKSEYYDPKASSDHPIWFCAEVSYEGHLKKPVTLQDLRDKKDLEKMALLQRGQRLSVLPMTKSEFEAVVKMGGGLK